MRNLILGTAGHIDHGKTALVRALTGVDTDRLAEEKARGITIDLGFAELVAGDVRFGVVDVPGHEGFVRNMLAGATGMDVVLLVVAADEGVMPQTREHLAIVELLGVRRVVVALTKADLVEEEWLELAEEDVRDLLSGTPYAEAPVIPTSAETGAGLEDLRELLSQEGEESRAAGEEDVVFLPVDRAFTVRGTGTVVTGTLWTGRIPTGERIRVLPRGVEARVRGLQVHGSDAPEAGPGSRVALALTGEAADPEAAGRGQAVVTLPEWEPSRMLIVRLRVLPDSQWKLEDGQRVRVHLGTAEVMARCVLIGADALGPGEEGWGQLRLEAPVAARVRQRVVLRSYSPVETFAGARVAEVFPPKRRRLEAGLESRLAAVLADEPAPGLVAALDLAGAPGVPESVLPVVTGLAPDQIRHALESAKSLGAAAADGRWVGPQEAGDLRERVLQEVETVHRKEPFRSGVAVERLRALAHRGAPRGIVDALLRGLEADGTLTRSEGVVARTGFSPTLTAAQETLLEELRATYRRAELQPPSVDALPENLTGDPAFPELVRRLESAGELVAVDAGLYVWGPALADAAARTTRELGGREGLGPADFKEVLPVSRRYLLPILRYFDGAGVTRNRGDVREVPGESS
jgi:selenocysteine-specific elongation factor